MRIGQSAFIGNACGTILVKRHRGGYRRLRACCATHHYHNSVIRSASQRRVTPGKGCRKLLRQPFRSDCQREHAESGQIADALSIRENPLKLRTALSLVIGRAIS